MRSKASPVADIAAILGIDKGEVEKLIDQAGREIAAQVATDVLVIEDEPMIAMDLEGIVEGLGHRVMGVARTHAEAVKAIANERPGLVLADIQLADGSSGLDAVNEMLGSFQVPVIFITAYPDRLLTGERPEPAFLITKPYQPDTVKAIVSQALFFERRAKLRDRPARGLDFSASDSSIRVRAGQRGPLSRSQALDPSKQQKNKQDHEDQSDHA